MDRDPYRQVRRAPYGPDFMEQAVHEAERRGADDTDGATRRVRPNRLWVFLRRVLNL